MFVSKEPHAKRYTRPYAPTALARRDWMDDDTGLEAILTGRQHASEISVCYGNPIMVSKNCPIIGKQVAVNFMTH